MILYFKFHLVLAHMNCSLPFKIGSNISIKNYNKFLESHKPSGYKFEYNNGNVFIIDMCTEVHEAVVALLQEYFRIQLIIVALDSINEVLDLDDLIAWDTDLLKLSSQRILLNLLFLRLYFSR